MQLASSVPLPIRAAAEQELRRRIFARQNTQFPDWLPNVTPRFTWDWKHLQAIYSKLYDIVTGKINRLMIFMPPRHGKTESVTVRFPAWMIERDPSFRFILAAYNFSLSSKFSRKIQRIVKARGIALEREAVEDWETGEEGGVRAVGVGSGVTGHGANGILIDDPVKSREEAYSATYREKVWDWYRDDLYTRLEPGGFIILIMTRWHHDDLAGRILADDSIAHEWTVLKLPAFAEANDPLGRKEGAALCPDRYDEAQLQSIKNVMKSDFESLYQQNPTAAAGEVFKRDWWQYYKGQPQFTRIIQSWDTAFKDKTQNDPSCCLTWGETDTGYYLIDRWIDKVTFPDLKKVAIQQYDKHRPSVVIVEDKASGQSLIQELKRMTSIPVLPIKPDKDKIARANAVTPLVESGRVYLPEGLPWVIDYVDQMSIFPAGAHDEDVDVTSQALTYMATGKKFFGDCVFED
jgi:predicted phage terminase large subunit-like protein